MIIYWLLEYKGSFWYILQIYRNCNIVLLQNNYILMQFAKIFFMYFFKLLHVTIQNGVNTSFKQFIFNKLGFHNYKIIIIGCCDIFL